MKVHPKHRIAEAPESNAGDDFHVLWTIKKSFDLLNFNNEGLKAITIEGIDPKVSRKLDPYGEKLLGVDLAEYFGSENFCDAIKVDVSQLKYSTRRESQNWTLSNLCVGKKKGTTDGSVIHRLAQIFKIFLDEFGRDLVINKLRLKLVSNRRISSTLKLDIISVQNYLKQKKSKTSISTLYKLFWDKFPLIEKLYLTSKLSSFEFTDYLRLLDFESCGTDSSYYQELEIISALQRIGIQNPDQKDSLFKMVWEKMLPNAIDRGLNKITEIDLLHSLHTSMARLFPVPQKFEQINNLIGRKQVSEIIDVIIKNKTGQPICLHGGAGYGKSIISQLIKKNFSKDSEVLLFDCYGEGRYLNKSDSRHLHMEALPHICNEMARLIGSPFLLSSDKEAHILLREFRSRVENAIQILRKRNPDSILVLIVDAADNSISAAKINQTASFVQDLVSESSIDGFRLVVTSRSHKISSLNLPEFHIEISLDPFNIEETEKNLKFYFQESTPEEVNEFHILTNGIPRVQTYALELRINGIKEVINYLRPNGKTVDDFIQERITEAINKLGSNGEEVINSFFTYFITLPRPVPMSYIELLLGTPKSQLKDLSIDIWHGIVLNNDHLSFRDEDFENFIRQKYIPTIETRKRIADLFLERASKDDYASIFLGISLYEANYEGQLKNIVLHEEYTDFPVDPLRRKEVYIERTKLAMRVCKRTNDNLTFFKLAFIAADAAKTDEALKNLLIQNIDLVSSFGEFDTIQRIQLQSTDQSWAGSLYYQLAAIYSRTESSNEIAIRNLKNAEKWVQWLQRQRDEEKSNFIITNRDIANGVETVLRLFGSQAAFDWLNRWNPKEAVFHASNILIDNILTTSNEEQIQSWLKPLKLPLIAKLLIFNKIKSFKTLLFDLNEIANEVIKALSKGVNFKNYLLPSIISFCETYIGFAPTKREGIIIILKKIKVRLPERVPSLMDSLYKDDDEKLSVDVFLRKETLISVLTGVPILLKSLYPESFAKIDEEKDYKIRHYQENEKNSFDRFYKKAISIYQFRIDVLTKNYDYDLDIRFKEICKIVKDDWESRYYDSPWVQYRLNHLALILTETLSYIKDKKKLLRIAIDSFEIQPLNQITLRLAIAKKISSIRGIELHSLEILDAIDTLIQKSPLPSSEMVNFYIKCSKISRSIEKQVSKYYFEKAVSAVSEIDIEAQEQIKCLSKLTQLGLSNENPQLAFEFARFVEYCSIQLNGYDHFPLEEGVDGIANLDCSTAFAVICRWSHRYITEISNHIIPILQISLTKGFVTPSIGGSMLPINLFYWMGYVEYIKAIIEKYDTVGDCIAKTTFVKNIIRDIKINCSQDELSETSKSIYEAIENGKFIDNEIVLTFADYYKFICELKSHDSPKVNNLQNPINERKLGENEHEESLIEGIDICSTTSLNEVLRKINYIDESNFNQPQISKLLNKIKNLCTPENYVSHLDALINISPELISFYSFEESLKERLNEWDINPLVRQWKKQNFGKVLKLWFSNFNWNDSIYYEGIKKFADIFGIDEKELSDIIINFLPEKIDELSATALYQTIAFVKNRLNSEENEKLISWVLPRWNKKISVDFADGIWDTNQIPPTNANEVIAKTIRFILGHPDKRIRWRGVHALRRLTNTGNFKILKILMDEQNRKDCYPFQNRDYTFFWISAKLYLWVCISRLSKENPKEIVKFKNEIVQELYSQELPHVLIKHFIKLTCLNLVEFDKALFTEEDLKTIKDLLVSKHKPVKEGLLRRKQRKYRSSKDNWRFDFDSMDTLPYWYSPLALCFNLSEYDVADIADKYISEKWGYTGQIHKDDHVKSGSGREYGLTRNDHGRLPTIENLQIYYEYHAMFCAANDLLESEPILIDDFYGLHSWKYWLESHGVAWKDFWLSDLRDPIPLKKRFWISEIEKFDENWRDNIEIQYYDDVLELHSEHTNNHLFAYGHYTRYFGENYESVSISSALVSIKTSESLLRSLQTAKDNYDYGIPLEDDEFQIKEGAFQLIGWLKEIRTEYEGLEKNDPFAYNGCTSYIRFGKEVEKLFAINYSENYKVAFLDGNPISTFQKWSNTSEDERYRKFESSGHLLEVNMAFLLKFLKNRRMTMIIECEITRHLRDSYINYRDAERRNNSQLYLLNSNGEIKSLGRRSFKIG